MARHLRAFVKEKPLIALVGASNNSRKYGSIILKDLLSKGFTVIPVNKHNPSIHGLKAYQNLTDALAEHNYQLIVYVIPPDQTLKSLVEANTLNLKNIWVQPGASNNEVTTFLREQAFNYVVNDCIMLVPV
ncbi:CoA-binding protein [candidate division CSSED10-310 bacterium]|uniref:CoA-binding protein n=1 Tax=candidate division CSSED10-310 bacterium TaxID=2855610 RepID=A0ABV6YVD6_UNCC1